MFIDVDSGSRLVLTGLAEARPLANGLMLCSDKGWTFIPTRPGSIVSSEAAAQLIAAELASWEDYGIFENAALSEAVFGWAVDTEVQGLLQLIPAGEHCLDIGCGFGRLLIPLAQKGRFVTGVDRSVAAIRSLHEKGYRAVRCPIEEFFQMGFASAFAALNTLRYLETWFAWNRHFNFMHRMLNNGGRYYINISLVGEDAGGAPIEWAFDYNGLQASISWSLYDQDLLGQYLLEHVSISNLSTGECIHQEYQKQLWVTASSFNDWIYTNRSKWKMERIWDVAWHLIEPLQSIADGSTYWIELLRL